MLAIAMLAACGGGDDDSAATTVPEPVTCSPEATGLTFVTEMATCAEAFARGRQLAVEEGLATGPDTPAAEQALATTCSTIQGTEPKTYESPQIATFAERLNSLRVCT